eukprot:TRINITY_DN12146_c0_g1_i1.p1 TRINITY_DN12146_c0_g1~~TRINITY_DN12146_c0_g1_i1.p1  ORF type:complete len:158 (+),score=14.70 TRINITY_DN12146_c0_g1_i1:91-564(+)
MAAILTSLSSIRSARPFSASLSNFRRGQSTPFNSSIGRIRTRGFASSSAISVTDENFADVIEKADGPVILDAAATWCKPCVMLAPILEKVVAANEGVKLAVVDIDQSPNVSDKLNVSAVPAVFAFYKGKKVDSFVGLKSEGDVDKFVKNLIKKSKSA